MPVQQDPASDLVQGDALIKALEAAVADLKAASRKHSVASARTAAKLAKAMIDALLKALEERAEATKATATRNVVTGLASKRARRAKKVSETGRY